MRTIALLLLCVGGLVAVLLFTDEKPKTKDSAELAVLDGRSLLECTKIRWQFDRRQPIEVTRAPDGRFQIAEPVVDLASAAYMKQIVDAWDSAHVRSTPLKDDAEGRKQAGLETPEVTFRAEFPNGQRIEVDIGAQGPLGATRFVRREGKIFEGGDALIESLRVGLDDLREHTVFRTQPTQASELRVEQLLATGKREALHLKIENGEWRLTEPTTSRADPQAAFRFLTAVLSLRVDDFLYGVTQFPTEEPLITILVRGTQGEETLRLWQEGGQVFGALPGRNMTFASNNQQYCQIFENAAVQLRATMLVPFASVYENLADVAVDPGQGRGDRVRLVRSSTVDEWRIEEPVQFAGHPSACNIVVQAINNLHAVEFVDTIDGKPASAADPRFGLGPGRLQVSLRDFSPAPATTLWFGAEVTKGEMALVYACRADESQNIVLVPKGPVDELRRNWTEFCALKVLMLTGIERLDLDHGGQHRTFLIGVDGWVQEGTPGVRAGVGEFVNDDLRDLNGKRAVDLRGGALGEADWRLTMARGNRDTLATMQVWDRGGDKPLIVQARGVDEVVPIGFELSVRDSRSLRLLWQ
ncbi:MAG: DUF4340 domain-containing protein [Planctomycetota bacterium]